MSTQVAKYFRLYRAHSLALLLAQVLVNLYGQGDESKAIKWVRIVEMKERVVQMLQLIGSMHPQTVDTCLSLKHGAVFCLCV